MTGPVTPEPPSSPDGVPSSLLAQLAGAQRQITAALVEMADVLTRLTKESDALNARMASLAAVPADPDLAAKVVTDPRQLATGLDLTDEERQAFEDALDECRQPDLRPGWAAAVAALRDDERYLHWWTARDYPPDQQYWKSEPRNHLADFLHTIGPDGPEVTRG